MSCIALSNIPRYFPKSCSSFGLPSFWLRSDILNSVVEMQTQCSNKYLPAGRSSSTSQPVSNALTASSSSGQKRSFSSMQYSPERSFKRNKAIATQRGVCDVLYPSDFMKLPLRYQMAPVVYSIYADGACKGNNSSSCPAGWGVVILRRLKGDLKMRLCEEIHGPVEINAASEHYFGATGSMQSFTLSLCHRF